MQVILLERVPKLGLMGEVVKVRAGFARNFLIPQGKALRATKETVEGFERRRAQLEANNLEAKEEAQKLAAKVDGKSVIILRQASETASLYGSVSTRDVAKAFTDAGITLDRQQIRLEEPLKTLGIHEVTVALHPEVEVTVTVNVARTQEEADIQAGKAKPPADEDEAGEEGDDEEDVESLLANLT
jgi:large subunit ribosomal protein L9